MDLPCVNLELVGSNPSFDGVREDCCEPFRLSSAISLSASPSDTEYQFGPGPPSARASSFNSKRMPRSSLEGDSVSPGSDMGILGRPSLGTSASRKSINGFLESDTSTQNLGDVGATPRVAPGEDAAPPGALAAVPQSSTRCDYWPLTETVLDFHLQLRG
eukprot:CAMPEP_0181404916 /NCGR_PEP_ID=MMETSP1110-20121109/4496_1 /TAXON_ID=174948 /ORGANISM="Symbiodinium sp., Strain CCMP421" /LENGTH=159 /DNA_ID=CAMNT_0023527299 /DNA_START=74 /DNA_END=551 /DNA_ORIENTATION=-